MSGLDHTTDINGNCTPDCRECKIEHLKEVISSVKEMMFKIGYMRAAIDYDYYEKTPQLLLQEIADRAWERYVRQAVETE